MDDQVLEVLENLKGRTVLDVVVGDMEGGHSFSQFASLKLDNNKQLTIASSGLEISGDKLTPTEEGFSALTAEYGELDDFWQEIEQNPENSQ